MPFDSAQGDKNIDRVYIAKFFVRLRMTIIFIFCEECNDEAVSLIECIQH